MRKDGSQLHMVICRTCQHCARRRAECEGPMPFWVADALDGLSPTVDMDQLRFCAAYAPEEARDA